MANRQHVELMALLYAALKEANELYASEGPPRRKSTLAALNAVNAFLVSVKQFDDELLVMPLANLAMALIELDDGKLSPLFDFEHRPGNKGLSFHHRTLHAYAAASVDLIMKTGFTEDQAAKLVAGALRKQGITLAQTAKGRSTSVEAQTVKNWRGKIRQNRSDQESKALYFQVLDAVRVNPEADPAAIRSTVIAMISGQAAKILLAVEKPTLPP